MPAFNEEESISVAVTNVRRALDHYTCDSEIIVVDDGSTDRTGARLDEIASAARLRVVHSPENRGYGWALRAGLATATRPLLFFTDSDDQFEPMDLGRLLPVIDAADIVIGHRVGRCDGRLRAALSRGYNALVRALLDVHVRDVNCAFKLVWRESLAGLGLTSTGYTINAEMLARAARARLCVREVPVSHGPRRAGRSKVGFTDVPRALAQLLALRRTLNEAGPHAAALRNVSENLAGRAASPSG